MNYAWKIAAGVILGLIIGFFVGRNGQTVVTDVQYVKGDPVVVTVYEPTPVSETVPDKPILPVKIDTTYVDNYIYVTQTVDSAAIIADYIIKRNYHEILFDDLRGKMELDMEVQYNKLIAYSGKFTPIETIRTVERVRTWIPFVTASYNTFSGVGVGGGVFYHDIALGVKYVIGTDKNGTEVFVMYKF